MHAPDPLRVLLVDDVPLARAKLRRYLQAEPGIAVAGEAGAVDEAVALVRARGVDLVLLDIQLDTTLDGGGLEVAERLRAETDRPVAVVFVTAHEQHALAAWRLGAIDYLLKPVERHDLRRALTRARRLLAPTAATAGGAKPHDERSTRIGVRVDGGVRFVDTARIDWIEAAGNYVALHVGAETLIARMPLKALHGDLDPDRFVQVHRVAVVNIARVAALRPRDGAGLEIELHDGRRVPVGRAYAQDLMQLLGTALPRARR